MATTGTKPRVLIVGAGLSGLALAQCLRKRGIPFEIFDRDTDISTRQGWAIAIHSILDDLSSSFASDMPPLRESADHLSPLTLEPQICFYGHGRKLAVENTPQTPFLRLNRLRFRQWLATEIPIQWGKRVRRVEEDRRKKQVTVHFEDGTSASGDVLVGADGMNSVVREHLLGRPNVEVLNSIPLSCVWGETTLSAEAFERQLSLGHSAYAHASRESGLFVWVGLNKTNHDLSGDYYWCVGWDDQDVNNPDHWLKHASKEAKLDHVVKITQSLEPKFKEIFPLTPVHGILPGQAIYRDAEIPSLQTGRIILIGDAAHPMTPFRGEGGVHAIRDALNLSEALSLIDLDGLEDVGPTLGRCQVEILERGSAAVRLSRTAAKNNEEAQNPIVSCGQVARATAEEVILLDNCKPRATNGRVASIVAQ
ncbi:FAD/NAD(P)-binding domain-containing protein [Nemania sp. NC0429]|nr:FAD/NAD(P)-binding domain-containing protein [Nemania sp. NC0429]